MQKETYLELRGLVQDYFGVQQKIKSLTTYEKYLHRTLAPRVSVFPVSFFASPENPIPSTFPSCYTTLNNQLTLPIEKQEIFPIRRVDIFGYTEDESSSLNSHIRSGPFLFRSTSNLEPETIEFEIQLEQEEQINHIRIPCMLPLPLYIESIQLLDSANRQTRIFTRAELLGLVQRAPVALELIFPLTPTRNIRVKFQEKLDTKKIGLAVKTTLNEIEANLSHRFAKEIELIDARAQLNKDSLVGILHDFNSSFKTLLQRQSLNSIEAWYTVLGIIIEASRTEFGRSGEFNTAIYYGNEVKFSAFRAEGKHVNHLYQSVDINDSSQIPITFCTFKVINIHLDSDKNVLSKFYVPHPLSRPLNSNSIELLTAQDPSDRKSDGSDNTKFYPFNMFCSNSSNVELYVPTEQGPITTSSMIEVDDKIRVTSVKTTNILLEDLIVKYPISIVAAPNLGTYSDFRPYYVSPMGSVVYKPAPPNVVSSSIHAVIQLHRVEYTKYVTPVIDLLTLVLGHNQNSRSFV